MKFYIGASGTEYSVDQAAAGNWCVDVCEYGREADHYACFDTESEAYCFILGMEEGEKPEEVEADDAE